MSQKQELGKGIKALIGNFKKESTNSEDIPIVPSSNVNFISLDLIRPNARQPRNDFNLVELEELSNSIKNLGLIQPITIRKISDNEYQIISGERRYRASLLAGLKEIPAYIRTANDNEMLEMALVENIQRVDLNPMEIAITYQRLLEEFDITQEKLAERVGKQRSTISNYARLLKLSPEIQNAVKSNKLSMGHARVLVGIENIILQKQLFDKTISEHLSVRSLEQLAQQYSTRSDTSKNSENKVVESKPNSMIKTLEDKLSASFGSKIQIKRNPKGDGHIIIKFNSDKALNDILDRFDNL